MANTAWGVISWVSVEMELTEWHGLVRYFRHSMTSAHGEPDPHGCHYGYTLWKAHRPGRADTIGMAWDWREVRPGVVGQDDPMSILTNVRLLRDGRELSAPQRILELNNAVHRIGWQRVARRHLQSRTGTPRPPAVDAPGARPSSVEQRAGHVATRAPMIVRPASAARPRLLVLPR